MGESMTNSSATTKATNPVRPAKAAKVKVMVALCGFGDSGAASSSGESVASDYATRRAQYGQRKVEAKRLRDEVVAWLKAHKGSGSYRRVSEATVFGTFTLEATPDLVALLAGAPHVESVAPVDEVPMTLLGAPTT